MTTKSSTIGVALGSGAARGWSHIGVLLELHEMGIQPKVVVGTSMGAVVGAAYCAGHLLTIEKWALELTRRKIFRLLDFRLRGGGLVGGKRLMDVLLAHIGERQIEDLPLRYAAVATRLSDGKELWLRDGSLVDAVRASMAIPGIFTPVRIDGDWLLDGGLCNPVPVSVCRAMGADVVIAVNLHGDVRGYKSTLPAKPSSSAENGHSSVAGEMLGSSARHQQRDAQMEVLFGSEADNSARKPGVMNAVNVSIDIMQTRMIRSRLAGDAPEVTITPRLRQLKWLEFERTAEAIEEGRQAVRRAAEVIEYFAGHQISKTKPSALPSAPEQ